MIQRPELPADMHAAMSRLNERTGEQLIAAYNAQCELGFTGVYAQAIQVLALHQQLKAKFGKGPLLIEDNALLTMVGPVHWDGKSWASDSQVPPAPASDVRLPANRVKDTNAQAFGFARDSWNRIMQWFRQRFGFFRSYHDASPKPAEKSKSADSHAEFMKRKYAELLMAHNAWADELEDDDF